MGTTHLHADLKSYCSSLQSGLPTLPALQHAGCTLLTSSWICFTELSCFDPTSYDQIGLAGMNQPPPQIYHGQDQHLLQQQFQPAMLSILLLPDQFRFVFNNTWILRKLIEWHSYWQDSVKNGYLKASGWKKSLLTSSCGLGQQWLFSATSL